MSVTLCTSLTLNSINEFCKRSLETECRLQYIYLTKTKSGAPKSIFNCIYRRTRPVNNMLIFLCLPLSSFDVCQHIQRAIHEFIAFFKICVCFSKRQLAMQVPAKRNAGCIKGFAFSFHIGLHGGADGRTEGRK